MITITPDAAQKLLRLIAKENQGEKIPDTAGVRLHLVGGGCSGYKYGLKLEHAPRSDDEIFESNGVRIFMDYKSAIMLNGVEISLENNLLLGINKFKITNPNAKSTCGCGESFEPK